MNQEPKDEKLGKWFPALLVGGMGICCGAPILIGAGLSAFAVGTVGFWLFGLFVAGPVAAVVFATGLWYRKRKLKNAPHQLIQLPSDRADKLKNFREE